MPHRIINSAGVSPNRVRPESVVRRAIAVLEAVARAGDGVSLSTIASNASVPKPTAYRLLRELAEAGFVRREAAAQGFSTGPRLEQLALALMQNGHSRTTRHAILSRLVEELGETCNITVLDGSQVLYVDRVESNSPLRAHLQPGSRVPLYCTASGKLFLARLTRARRDRLLAQIGIVRITARTIVDRSALELELAHIRKGGYAIDDEEYVAGLLCVAVPVIDRRGRTVAAVAVQAPVTRLPRERVAHVLPALQRAAQELAVTYSEKSDNTAKRNGRARRAA
ncbi:MAG: helix-turn-helix domain-containing protein [Betaproteobacteria bacterium]|nr:helix-turn-helix domain-containing protein [Betaproteobacteria bacterium]